MNWLIEKITDYWYVYQELARYISYCSLINKEKKKNKFKRLKLRVDWIGRVYTVINLDESESKWEEIEKRNLILDKLKEQNHYLTSLNLQEIITPNIRPVSSYEYIDEDKEIIKKYDYAYLVSYIYIFDKFNLWFLIKNTFLVVSFCYIWRHYGTHIMVFINTLIEGLSGYLN